MRLASQLTGWDIDILTEKEESERRQEEFRQRTQLFVSTLDVDEFLAQLLVTEGFSTVEDIAFVPEDELGSIEGLDEGVAGELRKRALTYLEARNAEFEATRRKLGVQDDVAAIDGLTPAMLVTLGEKGIKTLDDLGDLAGDELLEILSDAELSAEDANAIIMKARAHWFPEEEGKAEAEPEGAA